MNELYILTEDIASVVARKSAASKSKKAEPKLYGKKGEVVELINIRDQVAIVELKGDRFPVHINKIQAA